MNYILIQLLITLGSAAPVRSFQSSVLDKTHLTPTTSSYYQVVINSTLLPGFDNLTDAESNQYGALAGSLIIISGVILTVLTTGMNLMVMISFKIDKNLQTVSNYFLFSLAVADASIGLVSIPLMTAYTFSQSWHLGYVTCMFWLSVDYLMSNASVYNLLLISFDRYFSVTKPLTYRPRRTSKKAFIMIASTYIISMILWPPWIISWPYIEGVHAVEPNECMVQFLRTNPFVTIGTIIAAFFLPVAIMAYLYARVYHETEKRQKGMFNLQAGLQRAMQHGPAQVASRLATDYMNTSKQPPTRKLTAVYDLKHLSTSDDDSSEGSYNVKSDNSADSKCVIGILPTTCKSHSYNDPAVVLEENHGRETCETGLPKFVTTACRSRSMENFNELSGLLGAQKSDIVVVDSPSKVGNAGLSPACGSKRVTFSMVGRQLTMPEHGSPKIMLAPRSVTQGFIQKTFTFASKKSGSGSPRKQDSKAAKTLSAILLAFVLTWTPYSIIICIEALIPGTVPVWLWNLSYYLCYINSTVNPLCYALCNPKFRSTYIQIVKCKWRQESKWLTTAAYRSRVNTQVAANRL